MAPVALVVSHRGVLPVDIKGSHSQKSFWRKGLAPPSVCHASVLHRVLLEVLTLLLRSPSQWMFASPWRPQLSSLLFQPCVRDFGGLVYCVALCNSVPPCCWKPCEEMFDTPKPLPGFGGVCQARHQPCSDVCVRRDYVRARLCLAVFLFSLSLSLWTQNPLKTFIHRAGEEKSSRSEAAPACLCNYVIISCFLSKQEMTGVKMERRKVLP